MRSAPLLAVLALLVAVAALAATRTPSSALAVEAGLNCETYSGGVCVVAVGDVWFCDEVFQGEVCPSSIVVGETVRWEYPANGITMHTVTECGDGCVIPPPSSMWHSGTLNPGDDFEVVFDLAGEYEYYCQLHPFQRGVIRVLEEGDVLGDTDCNGIINSIDAALILQNSAGLLDALPCPQNADTSGDAQTNSVDASLILQYSAELINEF